MKGHTPAGKTKKHIKFAVTYKRVGVQCAYGQATRKRHDNMLK